MVWAAMVQKSMVAAKRKANRVPTIIVRKLRVGVVGSKQVDRDAGKMKPRMTRIDPCNPWLRSFQILVRVLASAGLHY